MLPKWYTGNDFGSLKEKVPRGLMEGAGKTVNNKKKKDIEGKINWGARRSN